MKKINKYISIALALAAATTMTSCNEWLGEESPGTTKLEDYFVNGATGFQITNACYTPLAWEFNKTYFSEWFFGDIASDDALKGGQNVSDGSDAYDIDNFKTNASNAVVLDYYRAKYQGIARCNLALEMLDIIEPDDEMSADRKECMIGEVHFLRAFYYFQLVRVFGGVPMTTAPIKSSADWKAPRASIEEVYAQIVDDLKIAESKLWEKAKYADEDMGRATKGAAQAMLCKVYLYQKDYANAYDWGKKFVDDQYRTGKYSLFADYADNFKVEFENGAESVFEIQYMEEGTSDYGEGNGFTRGAFTTILVRPRYGTESGWGWDHPTQNLFDEFEAGDPRREVTIGIPPVAHQDNAEVRYLENYYYNNKYAYMETPEVGVHLAHQSRSPFNYRLIRTSDVLLLWAEAALELGNTGDAKWALEEVRARARANSTVAGALPAFPGYNGYSDNQESLRAAIRHERRVELGMEGHRWFDLVRWGIAYEVLDKSVGTYGSNESAPVKAEMANFIKGKNELFPIPLEEILLNPMTQNPGY